MAAARLLLCACLLLTPSFSVSKESVHQNTATKLLGTQNTTFDYVIIGGGWAGLTLASRLSEDANTSVAVIEAGGFYERLDGNLSQIPGDDNMWTSKSSSDVNPLVDWGFNTTPQAGAFNQLFIMPAVRHLVALRHETTWYTVEGLWAHTRGGPKRSVIRATLLKILCRILGKA